MTMPDDIHPRRPALRSCLRAGLALMLVMQSSAAFTQQTRSKPKLPPGVDPGGVAIAIIGNGVDYTRPEIGARLARDGEGEIVGWDFVDNDRRPHAICDEAARRCIYQTLLVELAERGVAARLVVIRADPAIPQSLVQAMRLVGQLPVRVALLSGGGRNLPRAFLDEAAARFRHVLLIADAESVIPANNAKSAPGNLRITGAGHVVAAEAAALLAHDPMLDPVALSKRLRTAAPTAP